MNCWKQLSPCGKGDPIRAAANACKASGRRCAAESCRTLRHCGSAGGKRRRSCRVGLTPRRGAPDRQGREAGAPGKNAARRLVSGVRACSEADGCGMRRKPDGKCFIRQMETVPMLIRRFYAHFLDCPFGELFLW